MNRNQLAALAFALAATACGRSEEPGAPRLEPEATVAAAAAGGETAGPAVVGSSGELVLDIERTTPQFTVSSKIDPAIAAFDPALAALIAQAAKTEIDAFTAQAIADEKIAAEEAATQGGENWFRAYELQIDHKVTAGTPDIISIEKDVYYDTGGAHPNTAMAGAIYTRTSPDPVSLDAIFADKEAFREAVIAGLIEEKIKRGWEASERDRVAGEVRDLLTDAQPNAERFTMVSNIVLEPSDVPGKFGGVTVLYSPYDVGAYAEGPYTVTVPSEALQPMLSASWKDLFAGKPVVNREQ